MNIETPDPLSVGLIGCGRIGRAHISAADHIDSVRITALAGTKPPTDLGRQIGAELVTDDYRDILSDDEIDAVIIATPTDSHLPIALDSIRAGKHILVEKPVTLDASGASEIHRAVQAEGITAMVAQSRRFPPTVAELVRRLPEIGPVFRIHIQFLVLFPAPPTQWWKSAVRSRGLVVPLQGSHSLDSIIWWMGQQPKTVFATGNRRNAAWEGDDEADIICRFEGGEVATVHLSLSTSPPLHEAIIVGENGMLRLIEEPNGQAFSWAFRLEQNGEVVHEDPNGFPYDQQLSEFASAISEERPPLASLESVLPTMRTMDAAIASMERGVPVAVGDE